MESSAGNSYEFGREHPTAEKPIVCRATNGVYVSAKTLNPRDETRPSLFDDVERWHGRMRETVHTTYYLQLVLDSLT